MALTRVPLMWRLLLLSRHSMPGGQDLRLQVCGLSLVLSHLRCHCSDSVAVLMAGSVLHEYWQPVHSVSEASVNSDVCVCWHQGLCLLADR
jgi:hypothetical protein